MTVSAATTAGQILTSAYVNNNINSGLVYISSQTIGSAVSSVAVASCFSADYDNYRIVIAGGVGSTGSASVGLSLGASATGYSGVLQYALYGSGGALVAQDDNAARFSHIGNAYTSQYATSFELLSPFLAKFTNIQNASWIVDNASGNYNGVHEVATSFSGFTLTPTAGTLTGGTITVYGYRKA